MNYVGIDHHKQYSHITLLDEKGEKLKSGRVANLRSELENFLSGIEEGNRGLRWEAVWPAIRADFDLRCFYEQLKKRKGANSAKVATARRLLTIIYRMLKENRPYIPYKR